MPSGSMNGCGGTVVYPATRINWRIPGFARRQSRGRTACPGRRPAGIIRAPPATSRRDDAVTNRPDSFIRRALATLALPLVAAASLQVADVGAQAALKAPRAGEASPATGRQLLNSERIAERFGSYGIEVLAGGPRVRVSDLYSEDGGARTCRTFAVVVYPAAVDSAIAAEHDEIGRGGSIGAVFAAHGWQVVKTNLRYFEVDAPERVASLMRIAPGTRLAAHAYELDVARAGHSIEYALLVEIHHPDYLELDDLRSIYGPADAAGRERALDDLVSTALAAARGR